MNILQVSSRHDMRSFIELPYHIYQNDPVWVPPLRTEQHKQFDPKYNPFLRHCTRQLFLLEIKGRIVGRIAAFVDNLAVEFWKKPIGLFGYFECIPDEAAAQLLLETAREWLRGHDCLFMRGPWSFVSQEWGMVIEGFRPPAVIMAPYNPPYYNEFLTDFGMYKAKDLLSWYFSASEGYYIPERFLKLTDTVSERYGIQIRQLDKQHYDQEVKTIIDLSNASIINNWGYSPVTELEVQAMARDMKPIIQAKGVIFALDSNGRPIGFAIALPDVNHLLQGLNGRLYPFGFIKLLLGIPHLRRYRLFAMGVIPEYQGKAVDSLLFRALFEAIYTPDTWAEINYILEDNWPMINGIKKMGAVPLRRYRVYEMNIN